MNSQSPRRSAKNIASFEYTQMNPSTTTRKLLDAWVQSAPKRNAEVFQLLADSGLDRTEIENELAIKLAKPEPGCTCIPTFDPSVSRPLSPMLAQRMAYAGTIRNGFEKWLGPKDMQKAMATKKVLSTFASLKAHWENSAPARLKADQLALFAQAEEADVTLLAWESETAEEPKLIRYHGHSERVFKHLDAFLKWAAK